MTEPIQVSREVFLRENGWVEGQSGWSKAGAFCKPLPADSAFQLQAIIDDLETEQAA